MAKTSKVKASPQVLKEQGNSPRVLKEQGNSYFGKGQYEKGHDCYTRALDLLGPSSIDDDLYLQAVCFSNRSNCLLEMGKYEDSIRDSRSCLEILDEYSTRTNSNDRDTVKTLRYKNLLRLARASFYNTSHASKSGSSESELAVCHEALEKLVGCDSTAYAKRAKRMLRQLQYYENVDQPTTDLPLPRLTRANLAGPVTEYYPFGHDHSESALSESEDSPPLSLESLLSANQGKLGLFFGGVSDLRHIMVTVMDIYKQWLDLKENDKKRFQKAEIVFNDINTAAITRSVLVLVILYKIGDLAPTFADLKTDCQVSHYCTLLHYMWLSLAMPGWVNDLLVSIMEDVMSYTSRQGFDKVYPWLPCMSDDDWGNMRTVLSYWIDQAGGSTKYKLHNPAWRALPCVEECLNHYFKLSEDDSKERGRADNMAMQSGVEEVRDNLDARLKESGAEEKARAREMMADINNWSDGLLQSWKEILGPDFTPEKAVRCFLQTLDDMPEEDFKTSSSDFVGCFPGVSLDYEFLKQTHALLPPRQQSDHPAFTKIHERCDSRENWDGVPLITSDMVVEAREVVNESWKSNPTFFDPLWYSTSFSSPLDFDPIGDFLRYIFSDQGMVDPPNFDMNGAGKDSDFKNADLTEFCDYTKRFFWNTAHALVKLCSKNLLSFEWGIGDIISVCRSMREKGDPRFHRIKASNIPDYTGMLPFFTEVIPLLYESTDRAPTRLHTNVLLNTSFWKDYDHYMYSSTAIPNVKSAETILGMEFLGDDSVWGMHGWTWFNNESKGRARDDIRVWLHRLLLAVVLPAKRPHDRPVRENCPYTIAMFLRVCIFCVEWLNYPHHWVSCVLDELLCHSEDKPFKTVAQIPVKSPNSFRNETREQNLNLTSFLLDLRTQVAFHIQQRTKFGVFLPLETIKLPFDRVNMYELSIELTVFSKNRRHQSEVGIYAANCLSLVLEPQKPEAGDESGDNEDLERQFVKMSTMTGLVPERKEVIRSKILSQGAKAFQVLSCVDFTPRKVNNSIRFYMSRGDFETHRFHYVSILRTDSWFRLGKPAQLFQARIIRE